MVIDCLICKNHNSYTTAPRLLADRFVTCERCGCYIIEYNFYKKLKSKELQNQLNKVNYVRDNISGWISNQFENRLPAFIDGNCFNILLKLKPISAHEKANKFMRWMNKNTKYYGHLVQITSSFQRLIPLCFTSGPNEFEELLIYLTEIGCIKCNGDMDCAILTMAGFNYIEKYCQK